MRCRKLFIKKVLRWDKEGKLFRLCRFIWDTPNPEVKEYEAVISHKLTFAIWLFPLWGIWFKKEYFGWFLTIAPIPYIAIRVHFQSAYGGLHV